MSMNFKLTSVACFLYALAACWVAPAIAQNLILNPGFEVEGLNGEGDAFEWAQFTDSSPPTATADRDSTSPRTGSWDLFMQTESDTSGFAGAYQGFDVLPGATATFDVWGMVDDLADGVAGVDNGGDPNAEMRIRFEWRTGSSEISAERFQLNITNSLTNAYQLFSITDTAPAAADNVRVVIALSGNDDAFYFDDVSLTTTLPPNTPAFGLTVNRDTGNLSLENIGTGTGNIKEVKITSASGALDPISWNSITGNYDNTPVTGDGSVDVNDVWSKTVQTNFDLTEGEAVGDAGFITTGQIVDLGNDAWIKSITEDIVAEVTYEDGSSGTITSVQVNYTGGPNGGDSYEVGDLDFDGDVDAADWPLLRDQLFLPIATASEAVAYQAGDLNGDFKSDFGDLDLFKAEFNAALGAGAFEAMINGVPEPSSLVLLTLGALGISLSRRRKIPSLRAVSCAAVVALGIGVVAPATTYAATSVDFTNYTVDDYPLVAGTRFNFPTYAGVTSSTAVLDVSSNPHVFYGTQSILNKRITGTINPGADNDFIGLALGYTAGDTSNSTNPGPGGADFLLLDWKGNDPNQTQDLQDDNPPTLFHHLTSAQLAQEGVALSRVSGTPTGDELWGHLDLPQNTGLAGKEGGLTELQRGAASGSSGYSPNQDYVFDISYTSTQIVVKINGTEEINVAGSFPDGVLGLYSMDQNPQSGAPTYSNFEISDFTEVLTASVNIGSGVVSLTNNTSDPISLDGYALESPTSSLEIASWASLQDQDLAGFAAGNGTGNGWEEQANSSDAALVEANLATSSILGVGASVSLGTAFDTSGTQDLSFTYSEGNGLVSTGLIEYVTVAGDADFNDDLKVDGADFLIWQRGFGGAGSANSDGNADGDSDVDADDLVIWEGQYGTTLSATSSPSAQGVPEPSSALLLLLAGCSLGIFGSRRHQ